MKAWLVLLLVLALGILYFDDKSQREAVATMESRAEAATQSAETEYQQIEQLTNQINQLRQEGNRAALMQAQPGLPAVRPPAIPPSAPPEWFQQHLNGAPTVLDAHGQQP